MSAGWTWIDLSHCFQFVLIYVRVQTTNFVQGIHSHQAIRNDFLCMSTTTFSKITLKAKYNDLLGELIWNKSVFCFRHGDRTRAGATPCWPNDTAVWDCLLTSASLPVVKHDTHDITVDRIYRDGVMFCSRKYPYPSDKRFLVWPTPPPPPAWKFWPSSYFPLGFCLLNLPSPWNYPLNFLGEGGGYGYFLELYSLYNFHLHCFFL